MQNTEMRMCMQRITDKIDQLLANQISPRNGQLHTADIGNVERDIKHIIEQNNDIKENLLERRECVSIPIQVNQDRKTEQEEEINGQSERIKELERQLKEKDAQTGKVSRTHFERITVLEEKLEEASKASEVLRENAKDVVKSEMKKMMSSTAKVLLAQFIP